VKDREFFGLCPCIRSDRYGLPEFIRSPNLKAPLFYSQRGADEIATTKGHRTRAKSRKMRCEETVALPDPGVWPNHGWRHRFKTMARDFDIGHANTATHLPSGPASLKAGALRRILSGRSVIPASWAKATSLARPSRRADGSVG